MTLRSGPYEHLRTAAVYDALERLERLGDPTTLALAWVLADERVSVVIGPRRPAQLAPALAALAAPMAADERQALSDEFRLVLES
jgi:aryl-alcohol dehydrogenase-like predicted oxidoreductase